MKIFLRQSIVTLVRIAPLAALTAAYAASSPVEPTTPSNQPTMPPSQYASRPNETMGEYMDDATITTKVKAALVKDGSVKARMIKVVTDHGVVNVTGTVATPAQKDQVEARARRVPGVKDVRNNIAVK